jgi:hypothetical protein
MQWWNGLIDRKVFPKESLMGKTPIWLLQGLQVPTSSTAKRRSCGVGLDAQELHNRSMANLNCLRSRARRSWEASARTGRTARTESKWVTRSAASIFA